MHPGIGIVNFVLRQQPQLTEHVGDSGSACTMARMSARSSETTRAPPADVSAGTRKAIDLPAPVGSTMTTSRRLRDGRPRGVLRRR
jgi:hypothetical protein